MKLLSSIAALVCLASLSFSVGSKAQTQQMPLDLIGAYTSGPSCNNIHFRIETSKVFDEDMGCDVLSVKRLYGEERQESEFEVHLSCQMDDPEKPRMSGFLKTGSLWGRPLLIVNLQVDPKYRKKFGYPRLQVYGKCK